MLKPGYHIHVDAQRTSAEFEKFVIDQLGFWPQDFLHEEGDASYAPARHLTHHPRDSQEFKLLFGKLKEYLTLHPNEIEGYIEGECVPCDWDIERRQFDELVVPPFKVSLTQLPAGEFREDEIHVSLSRDRSDYRLQQSLRAMGLYVAYLPKADDVAAIFTVQGSREHIDQLLFPLHEYLQRAGGGVGCSIKEERIADWWVSSPSLVLPPVVQSIEWR